MFWEPFGAEQFDVTYQLKKEKQHGERNEHLATQEKRRSFQYFTRESTYDEIVTENDYLGRRVVELLELVEKMEKEKKKMEELSSNNI